MKYLLYLMIPILLVSCSKKVSESDLIGHSYNAQYDLSKIATENAQEQGFVQMAGLMKRVYKFEAGGKGTLEAVGLMTVPINWAIQGDSISVTIDFMGKASRNAYAITSNGSTYSLNAKDQAITLKPL